MCVYSDFSTELFKRLNDNNFSEKSKLNDSVINFAIRYNEWHKYMIDKINGNINSIRINVI